MTRPDLKSLLERVRSAEKGSRELDWHVADYFDHDSFRESSVWPPFMPGSKADRAVPAISTSIDAVVSLIEKELPGWVIGMRTRDVTLGYSRDTAALSPANHDDDGWRIGKVECMASSMPLALLAALLAAKLSMENTYA